MSDTPIDLSDDIQAHLMNYAVGLVRRDGDVGSSTLGSGTLVSIEGRRGILTCGHVAEQYAKLTEIGVVHFREGDMRRQRRLIKLGDAHDISFRSGDTWTETGLDLSFTLLSAGSVASLEAQGGVFLNFEKNRIKAETPGENSYKAYCAMLGLVAEDLEEPYIEGTDLISPLRGVLHTGRIVKQENGLLTVEAMEYNVKDLPKDFGGMSGAGLWRVEFVEEGETAKIVRMTFCGVASWQIDNKKIACQGWDRIDQTLVPDVLKAFQ